MLVGYVFSLTNVVRQVVELPCGWRIIRSDLFVEPHEFPIPFADGAIVDFRSRLDWSAVFLGHPASVLPAEPIVRLGIFLAKFHLGR